MKGHHFMSTTQRPLTEDEKRELAELNAAVSAAIEARRNWLDAKMHETSRLQVGDDIYHLRTGLRLGKVSELYRFWANRDDGIRDTSIECHYKYATSPLSFSNTSSQRGPFGTLEDAIGQAEAEAARLQGLNARMA